MLTSSGKGFARGDALVRHRQRNICIGGFPPDAMPQPTPAMQQHHAAMHQQSLAQVPMAPQGSYQGVLGMPIGVAMQMQMQMQAQQQAQQQQAFDPALASAGGMYGAGVQQGQQGQQEQHVGQAGGSMPHVPQMTGLGLGMQVPDY